MKVAPRVYGGDYQNQSSNRWLHGMVMDRFRFIAPSRCKSCGREFQSGNKLFRFLVFIFIGHQPTDRPPPPEDGPINRPAFYVFLLAGCKLRFYLFCCCHCFNNNVIVVVGIDIFFLFIKRDLLFLKLEYRQQVLDIENSKYWQLIAIIAWLSCHSKTMNGYWKRNKKRRRKTKKKLSLGPSQPSIAAITGMASLNLA